MKRATVYWWLDVGMGILGAGVAATGLMLEFVLPPRSRGEAVLGWTRHDWGELHFMLALGVLCFLAVHLTLHWGWLWSTGGRIWRGDIARRSSIAR